MVSMRMRRLWEKYGNHMAAGLVILCHIVLIGVLFDFYYDINDDVLIKDIMAGVYTGTPDGHNMQTLYLLGAALSLLYRVFRNVPWFGLFLFLCQFGSLYLVGVRLLSMMRSRTAKAVSLVLLSLLIWSVLLGHLAAVQYTVASGMMGAAAVFLMATTETGLPFKEFLRRNMPAVVLIILAYQLRTEMMLFLLPMAALAGLTGWLWEKPFWHKEHLFRYAAVFGIIALGMFVSRGIDYAAYGSEEWRDFLDFFAYRTEVYDYHLSVMTDEAYAETLQEMGITPAQRRLLANYNFGLSEEIDSGMMRQIAAYAAQQETGLSVGKERISGLLSDYRYRVLHMYRQDGRYGGMAALAYLFLFAAAVCAAVEAIAAYGKTKTVRRDAVSFLAAAFLLCLLRTALWLFLMIRGRMPERILHPLCLAEALLAAGLVWRRLHALSPGRLKQAAGYAAAALGILVMCAMLPDSLRAVRTDAQVRRQVDGEAAAIDAYCRAHGDCFYFEDVYSTVAFSQEMFRHVDNTAANYDIMGGWACKSPVWRKKLERFQIDSVSDGLLHRDGVYVIQKDGLQDGSTEWLAAYYAEQGIAVEIERIDTVIEKYSVYRVREAQPPRTEGRQTDGADIS